MTTWLHDRIPVHITALRASAVTDPKVKIVFRNAGYALHLSTEDALRFADAIREAVEDALSPSSPLAPEEPA